MKPENWKPVLFGALLALLCLGAIETFGNISFYLKCHLFPYSFATKHFYQPIHLYMTDHPYLPYIATQGKSGTIQFNSMGDRGEELDEPKRRIRILCYGGSTTFDAAHEWDKTWPGYLQSYLGKDKYEVVIAAQNGATTADTLVNYALIHMDTHPDYILAYEGINDLESSYFPGFKPDYSHRRRKIADIPYPIFYRLPRRLNHSAIYVALRWTLVGPRGDLHALFSRRGDYDFKNGPFGLTTFRRNLASLNSLARDNKAKLILGTVQYYQPLADGYFGKDFGDAWRRGVSAENNIVRELARSVNNIYLADAAASFIPTPDFMIDFCHLTERGNERIAKTFYEAILRAEGRVR